MTSKDIKRLVKIKDMTKFYGLGQNTISNYLKNLRKIEESGVIPPTGRHNIVKALTTYYLLNSLEGTKYTTKLEDIRDRISFIEDILPSLDKDILDKKQKEKVKEQIKEYLEDIKEIIDDLM